jgi:hypothetical protein
MRSGYPILDGKGGGIRTRASKKCRAPIVRGHRGRRSAAPKQRQAPRRGIERQLGPPFKDIVKSEDDLWKIVAWIKSLGASK